MKQILRSLAVVAAFLAPVLLRGQTTVFTDDFNRGSVVTPLSNGGSPSMTYTTATTSTGSASTGAISRTNLNTGSDYTLQILAANSAATPTAQTAGATYTYGALSTFSAPFNTTLSSNVGDVTWTFNMRTNRTTALSGFGAGGYGSAVVLAGTNSTLTTSGNGYAVIEIKGTTINTFKLIRYTNGLNGTQTSIIAPGADFLSSNTSYVSVRVVYKPSTNDWQLYLRDDTSAGFADPSSGVTTQIGTTTTDNTYTGSAMTSFGFFWNHSATTNATSNTSLYDNFKVVVNNPTITTPSPSSLTGLNYGVGTGPSSSQSFTTGGTYLLANVTVTAPTNFEVSTDNSIFSPSVSLTQSSGTVATTTIYTRLAAGLSANAYSGNITIASTNATSKTVSLSGAVTSTPTISVSTASLTAFANTDVGSSSATQTFTVNGSALTAGITVTAPTNFEVSTSSGSGFGSSVVLAQSGGAVAVTTIYARFTPTGSGSYSGNIVAASTGATDQNVAVSAYPTYYYKGSGSLASVANWAGKQDGTGTVAPADFIGNNAYFKILTNTTTDAAWTVAGTASKIIVGDPSVSAVTLTIASGFGITTTSPVVLDIAQALSGSNSVVLQDATTTPSFGTMHSASEVHYQANISTGTTKTFGKLFVDGSGATTTFSGTPVVQTSLTVASGSTMATGNLSGNFVTLNSGASVTIVGTFKTQKTAGFTSANVVTAGSSFAAIQFIGAESSTLGAASTIEYNRTSAATAQTITARTDYANLILSDAGVANNKTFAGITTVSVNLTLNLSASAATAGGAITTGTLTLTAGKLTLGANDLTATTLSGGSSTSYIVTDAAGKLISPTSAGVLKTFPIGASSTSYDPVDVTPTNGVTFSAKVATSFVNAVSDNTKVAAREWNVSATGAGSTVMSLTNGGTAYTPTTARIGHYTGSAWEEFAATFSANTWTATNASGSFSPFGGGNLGAFNSAVLAVELQSFAALAKGRANELTWTTSQEKNHESFIIERSFDGKDFKTIGTVKSQGASSVEKVYHFTDDNPLSISYYRLKMQDVNGTEQVSKTVAVNRNDSKTYVLECYPSVVHDKITVLYAASENALLTVTNLLGQVVLKKDLTASLSPNAFDLDLSNLSKGLYLLRLDNNQTHLLKKIITE